MENLEDWAIEVLDARKEAVEFNGQIQKTLEVMLNKLGNHAEEEGIQFRVNITKEGDVFDASWDIIIGRTKFNISTYEVNNALNKSEYDPNTGQHVVANREISDVLKVIIKEKYVGK